MSTTPPPTKPNAENSSDGFGETVAGALPTIFTLAVIAVGWVVIGYLIHGGPHDHEVSEATDRGVAETLQLPEGKIAAAKLKAVAVTPKPIHHIHNVPGRLQYDETKHVHVKAPLSGIVIDVEVTPGESIQQGQPIATINSAEIGQARNQVVKSRKDVEIASQWLRREKLLADNLKDLFKLLDASASEATIETQISDKALGSYRQEILSSFARFRLAKDSYQKIQPLVESGSVSGKTARERRTELQIAENDFRAACDQAAFAAKQSQLKAEAELAEANRQLTIARRAVETLLGFKEEGGRWETGDQEALSQLEVRAPFAGTVEEVNYADGERVARGEALIVLANTDSLYVAASIRESDWPAVTLEPGTTVQVVVPALEDRVYPAKLRYIGRQVDPETNSIPLVATIENCQGILRPGMFVRVAVPIGGQRTALSIKSESLLQHEGQTFVFVKIDDQSFKRVDVAVGDASDRWVEITEGLSPGEMVVTDGAFLLKSEWLLQGE